MTSEPEDMSLISISNFQNAQLRAMLLSKISKADLLCYLSDYVSNSSLSSQLSNYPTQTDLSSYAPASGSTVYATQSELSSYATASDLSTLASSVYSKQFFNLTGQASDQYYLNIEDGDSLLTKDEILVYYPTSASSAFRLHLPGTSGVLKDGVVVEVFAPNSAGLWVTGNRGETAITVYSSSSSETVNHRFLGLNDVVPDQFIWIKLN